MSAYTKKNTEACKESMNFLYKLLISLVLSWWMIHQTEVCFLSSRLPITFTSLFCLNVLVMTFKLLFCNFLWVTKLTTHYEIMVLRLTREERFTFSTIVSWFE